MARAPIPFAAPDISDAEEAAVLRVMRSGWLTTGEEATALEAELSAYLGVPHVVAVSSCTAAIEIAYAALELPAGARVGVPTWTFASSALAPHHHGARIVLLDVDDDTLNVSADAVARALDAGLDALVMVHFGGTPVSKDIHAMCAEAGVPVIEDAAHALGSRDHRGLAIGAGSVGACLSFYATKNLTCAEGGALVTDRDDVADFARSFRLHGMSRDAWARYEPGGWAQYDLMGPGIKANLPDVLAAIARVQLTRFDDMQDRRRVAVERYRARLAELDGLRFVPGDRHPGTSDHLVVVVLPDRIERASVQAALTGADIASSVHFQPLHRFRWFGANAELAPGGVPVAERVADHALSLPLSPMLTVDDVDRVCDVVLGAAR